ncbi:Kdo domain containing protein [Flavobacterium suncheonense]|uniref:Kdo domain containing protein n=1 Tax=Flavobacterium suncheonense TaxID=350894 RepID=UPI003FA39920
MEKVFNPEYKHFEDRFDSILKDFETSGEQVGFGKRNAIRAFDAAGLKVNVKSFKSPNFINGIVYGFFRKSKAQRSFEYANLLLNKGIGTPQPFAYYLEKKTLGLQRSYYFSQQQDIDGMFQTLRFEPEFPDREEIIRQSAAFYFKIHNEGIEFMDNTGGNTLFRKRADGEYDFFLVDLNRMKFHESISLEQRAKNLAKLTTDKQINSVLGTAYAKLYQVDETLFCGLLQKEADKLWDKFERKRQLKRKLKFWKNY